MVTITNKEEQPLLGRTLITAEVSFEGATPDRATIRKQTAKAAGVKEEELIIKRIISEYGKQHATIEAALYKNIADAKAVEHKSLMAKHEKKEEPKEEAAPEEKAEEKKEDAPAKEAPAEEKKEDAPKEEAPAAEEKKDE